MFQTIYDMLYTTGYILVTILGSSLPLASARSGCSTIACLSAPGVTLSVKWKCSKKQSCVGVNMARVIT